MISSKSSGLLTAVCCVVLILQSLVSPSEQHEEHMEVAFKQVSLDDICANRQVPIISVSEATRLIGELRANPGKCPEKYLQSMYELEPVLSLSKDLLLCSDKKFKQVKEYHFRYVNPKVETYKLGDDLNHLDKVIQKRPLHEEKFDYTVQLDDYNQEILIPISIQQFFKAWALQMSGLCKQNFVGNIVSAMNNNMDVIDLELIEKFGNPKELNPITNKPHSLNFDALVYMPELEGELNEGDLVQRNDVTILNLLSKPELNKFMHACKSRFEPIYSKLVLPIVRMAKLGYDYVGPKIDNIRSELQQGKWVRKWLVVTSICESVGNFDLVEKNEDDEGKEQEEGGEGERKLEQVRYFPEQSSPFGDTLWILGAEALRAEFERITGSKATGLKRFLFNAGVGGRKLIGVLDPHQFRWYRRNQNSISSALNIASFTATTASTAISMGAGRRK